MSASPNPGRPVVSSRSRGESSPAENSGSIIFGGTGMCGTSINRETPAMLASRGERG